MIKVLFHDMGHLKYQWTFTIINTSVKTNTRLINVSKSLQNSYRRQVNSQKYNKDKETQLQTKIQIKQ